MISKDALGSGKATVGTGVRFADTASSTSREPGDAGPAVGRSEATSQSEGELTRECKKRQKVKDPHFCELCGKGPFKGSRGLGTHKRLAHPEEWNELQKERNSTRVRSRWTQGERELLCQAQGQWEDDKKGEVSMARFIQRYALPDRSLGAIKSQLRSERQILFAAARANPRPGSTSEGIEGEREESQVVSERYVLTLGDETIESLEKQPDGDEYLEIYRCLTNGRELEAGERARAKFEELASKYTPLTDSQRPRKAKATGSQKGRKPMSPSKQRRKERWGRCQAEWRGSNRSRLIRSILRGKFGEEEKKDPEETLDLIKFWKEVFGREPSPNKSPG